LVRVMRQQGRQEEALAVMAGKQGELLRKDHAEYLWWKVQLHQDLHQHKEALQVRQEQLKTSSNDWTALRGYIEAFLALGMEKERTEDLSKFIIGLQAAEKKEKSPSRSPFLARCELDYVLLEHSKKSKEGGKTKMEALERLSNSLQEYFLRFGHRTCFFNDVEQYLGAFLGHTEESSSLYQSLVRKAAVADTTKREGQSGERNKLCLTASYHQCAIYLGLDKTLPVSQVEGTAEQLWQLYLSSLPLSQGKLSTERGVGDSLAQLVGWLFLRLYERTGERGHLLEAVRRVRHALYEHTDKNFQLRLMLVRLYCHPCLGATGLALQEFKQLGVKEILLDSCSHLALTDAVRHYQLEGAEAIIK